jgi:hypothetical protein
MATTTRKPRRYAQGTTIDPAKSRAEIETLVTKHGATGYVSGWQGNLVKVMFEMRGRRLRFSVDLPDVSDRQFTFDGHRRLPPAQAQQRFEQFVRERWRLLLFLIKGKLEAIREGAAIFEEEMMAYTVMPNGQTVAEWANPQLAQILDRNEMPPLLPG